MKKVIYYLTFLFVIYSCIPYKSYQRNDTICDISYIKLKEYEMRFEERLNPLEEEWSLVDSGKFLQSFIKYSNNGGFSITKKYKQDNLYKNLNYDYKGHIKSVAYTYGSLIINTSYFFDTSGNITKTIDERQADKYPICFREAVEIVKRKTPKHYTIETLERNSMMIKDKKVYYWLIVTGEPEKLYVYYVNAKTGKIFKKFRSKYAYD